MQKYQKEETRTPEEIKADKRMMARVRACRRKTKKGHRSHYLAPYRPEEIAQYLGISVRTLYRRIAKLDVAFDKLSFVELMSFIYKNRKGERND